MSKFSINKKYFNISSDMLRQGNATVLAVPRNYTVEWKAKERAGRMINDLWKETQSLLIIDKMVYKLYGSSIRIPPEKIFIVEAVEKYKTIITAIKLINFFQTHFISKGSTLLVVGGGITQDISAFAAGLYKRGVSWLFIPTTLLAMCDSCIGAKACLNHNNAKNQLSFFSAPARVVINPFFIDTLSPTDIGSGLGEILKLQIMAGRTFFDIFVKKIKEKNKLDKQAYKLLILSALAVKKSVIEFDEFEKSERKGLNYGHTFGHAIEVLTNYEVSHGIAVATGIYIVNEISKNRKLLPLKIALEIKRAILQVVSLRDIALVKNLSVESLFGLLKKDKKTIGNKVNFVLAKDFGKIIFCPIELNRKFKKEISNILINL